MRAKGVEMSLVLRDYTRVSALVAGFLVALTRGAPAQTNTWIQLSPTPTTQWAPSTLYDCTGRAERNSPFGRAFSGSAMGGGKLFYWGGGHQSYPGNDVIFYDIATNQWVPDPVQPDCIAPCCVTLNCAGGPTPGLVCTQDSECGTGGKCLGSCDNAPPYCLGLAPSCLAGSCFVTTGTGVQKSVYRCSGGTRDGNQCSQDSDCTGPPPAPGGTCSGGIPTPGTVCTTCKPYTEHTYQHLAYNPVRGKFFVVTIGIGTYTSGTWEWDPATRAWTMLQVPSPTGADQSNRMLVWDTTHQRMLYLIQGSGTGGAYTFDYGTNRWTLQDSFMPFSNTWAGMFGFWDRSVNKLLVAFSRVPVSWYLYDSGSTGAAAWTDISASAPADVKAMCSGSTTVPCFSSSVTYDVANQRSIVMSLDAGYVPVLWGVDTTANPPRWTRLTVSNPPTLGSANAGSQNMLHYDAGTGSLYFLDAHKIWTGGSGGPNTTWNIQLDLGNRLPTNTPANTATPTPTRPTPTPTRTPTITPTQPSPTPTRTPTITPTQPTPTPRAATPTPGGPTTPTPTCAGTVRLVGPGRTYTNPSQAAAVVQTNDCVYIDAGTYPNDVALWPATARNVTIRGVGGMVQLTVTNGIIYGNKGIWVIDGANTTIENMEFSCATSRIGNTNCSGVSVGDIENAAGIRLEAGGLTIRNCFFHDNDNSILGGPNTTPSGDVLIEYSEFFRNGWGDGQSHNLYLNQNNLSLTYRYNYSHGAIVGHNLKSRAQTNYILYNRIMDEDNGITGNSNCNTDPAGRCMGSAEAEFPCGGLVYVIGNIMEKGTLADSKDIIKFGAELGKDPATQKCIQPLSQTQELYVINNTLVTDWTAGVPPSALFIAGVGMTGGTTPNLWAKNNIFLGAGTPITWPVGTVVDVGNLIVDPSLVSRSTYDYRLTPGSAAISYGIDPGVDAHGYSLKPTQQYVYDRRVEPRVDDGHLDAGAYEYVAPVTAFPTRTSTATYTPPVVIWTPTPAVPVYCAAGQSEAVYAVAKSADDGTVLHYGNTYASLGNATVDTNGFQNTGNAAVRRYTGTPLQYKVGQALWRWNTATHPDGSAWLAGTQIVGAYVRPVWSSTSTAPRPAIFEWHHWTTLSDADWTLTSATIADPTYAASVTAPATGRQTIALSSAAANVNLAGYTGMRLTMTDTTPPAVNEDNTASVRPVDFLVAGGDLSTQLVLCYLPAVGSATPTPSRPSPPRLL